MEWSSGALVRRLASVTRRRAELGWETRASVENPAAATYHGLTPRSLAFATLHPRRGEPHVNLVLPTYAPNATFAGIKTALETGAHLAGVLGWKLRVVALRGAVGAASERALRDFVHAEFGLEGRLVTLVAAQSIADTVVTSDDLWIATFWTTAHAIDVACRLGLVDPARVMYLVQDYEPGFLPVSTPAVLAAATYHAGFTLLVNSSPLADYLRRFEKITVPDKHVFAPSLDLDRLERTQRARTRTTGTTVLFYGRPSKPRNMFPLGVAALRATAHRLPRQDVTFVSVGEQHGDIVLGPGRVLRSVGKLSWSGYFDQLATAEVVLSLQASPHPSHPPLDAVVSGGVAVTNELGGTRAGRHDRLLAVAADPDRLAVALTTAVEADAASEGPGAYAPEFLASLGQPLPEAAEAALGQLVR